MRDVSGQSLGEDLFFQIILRIGPHGFAIAFQQVMCRDHAAVHSVDPVLPAQPRQKVVLWIERLI
ncbi:MAG: hypothetical protein DRP37_07380 [Thermodesulfobacteriota bacterium]|nr:MAG: hypothetical protein DRP37_07380 [Thermodesulfobacteriota bacterium]